MDILRLLENIFRLVLMVFRIYVWVEFLKVKMCCEEYNEMFI